MTWWQWWLLLQLPAGIAVGKCLHGRSGRPALRLPTSARSVSNGANSLDSNRSQLAPTFLAGASTREGEGWPGTPFRADHLATPATPRVYSPGTPKTDALIASIPTFQLLRKDEP